MHIKEILIISAVFPPEPVVSAMLSFDIAAEISKTVNTTVIAPKPTRPFGFIFNTSKKEYKFKYIQINSFTCPKYSFIGRIKESYSFGKHCSRIIKAHKSKIQIIYCNTWPFFAQYLTVKAAIKYKIPIILHVQDIYPESLSNKIPFCKTIINRILIPIDGIIQNNASKIIAISENMKKYIVRTRRISDEKIIVIQNWQDEEKFINVEKVDKNNGGKKLFTFMYLGNIGPVAGIDLLIDAFLKTGLTECRLIIAGSGSQKETLKEKVKILKTENIEFWDVPEDKIGEIQNQADVMLLPVKKNAALSSIPSKLPAYLFSKKAVIASVDFDSDTAEAIRSSNCGWIVPAENIDMLSQKMKEITLLPYSELQKKGENGYLYAIKNYSKRENIKKIIEIFRNT